MPAIDQCEPQIVNALQKAGWIVINQPYAIRWDEGYIYADLRLEDTQSQQTMIVVEVKCFPNKRSSFEEFYQAIGQYLLYRNALTAINDGSELFLAVPEQFFKNFLGKKLIQITINNAKINLIVVNLSREVVVQWITW